MLDQISSSFLPNDAAGRAGLNERYVIAAVNDKKIDQTHSLTSLLGQHQPGDRVKPTIARGTKTLHFNVMLGAVPSSQ